MNKECGKLEKKYNHVIKMLKESFIVLKNEIFNCQIEKDKKNSSIITYKKRVSEQLNQLQKSVNLQEKMIDFYKNQNLELTKETFLLKNKFKKTAFLFSKKKEDNLIYEYFKDDIEIENLLNDIVNKTLKNKFNPKEISPLYFRKELNNSLRSYLIKELIAYTKIEKIAILLSSILLKKFYNKIYLFITSFFVDRIENEKYSDFVQILFTKTLVDKDTKYKPIQMEYSIDDIKRIYHKYKYLSVKKEDLFMKIDLEKVDKNISNCLEKIDKNEKNLENLTIEENNVLVKLTTSEEDKEEAKKELENIDVQKRTIIDNIRKSKKELEILENQKMFLEPVNEVVFENLLKDKEKHIIEKYNNMLCSFAFALEEGLK